MTYFYYNVHTIFGFDYKDNDGKLKSDTFEVHHTVSDKCYKDGDFKKTIYYYGVDRAFNFAHAYDYDVVAVRIIDQKIWLSCVDAEEDD